jgi:hypothetical protein
MVRTAPNEQLVFEPNETIMEPSNTARKELSHKAEKRAFTRFEKVKTRVAEKLSKKKAERAIRKVAPPPRYDEVFFKGLDWLDTVAGERIESPSGEISFDDNVWKSPTRGELRG